MANVTNSGYNSSLLNAGTESSLLENTLNLIANVTTQSPITTNNLTSFLLNVTSQTKTDERVNVTTTLSSKVEATTSVISTIISTASSAVVTVGAVPTTSIQNGVVAAITTEWINTTTTSNLLSIGTTNTTPPTTVVAKPEITRDALYGIFMLNGIMSLLGILGNIFVCLIIARGRKMYTIANLFLMNLAIADMCVLLVSYPLWVLQTLTPGSWPFGVFLCKLIPSISDSFYGISLGCMTAISVHRYRMILHAMDRQLTFREAKFIIVFIWFISLATISAPLYPVLQYYELKTVTNITVGNLTIQNEALFVGCASVWPNKTYERTYQIFLTLVWYVLPLLIILFTFLRIKWYLEKQMVYDWLKASENTVLVANHIMGIKKALRMLAPIVIIFALLMLPWNVIRMVSIIIDFRKIPHVQIYIVVAGTMLIANSVVNPFVYYLMSSEFRLEFKKQVWLLKRRLGISKQSEEFTIEVDKTGRKFVRRLDSIAEYDSGAYFRQSTTQCDTKCFNDTSEINELSSLRVPSGNHNNDYDFGEYFQPGNDDYADLRYSISYKSPTESSGLYRIVEERSVDIDYKDFESENIQGIISDNNNLDDMNYKGSSSNCKNNNKIAIDNDELADTKL